jgi:hypothetical protein
MPSSHRSTPLSFGLMGLGLLVIVKFLHVFVSLPLFLNIHSSSSHNKYSGMLREKHMLILVSCVSFICVNLSVCVCVCVCVCPRTRVRACVRPCNWCMGVKWHRSVLRGSNPSLTQGGTVFPPRGVSCSATGQGDHSPPV